MHENEAPVLGDIRVVSEREPAIHSNEASVHRVIRAERGNAVRRHIEEAQMPECEACVYRNWSPVRGVIVRARGSHAWLHSCDARVRRSSPCLYMSCTHVHRDISVVD
jgi:hypothetical protein